MAYVYQRDLAMILRDAGVEVVEYAGWKDRGRPPAGRNFNPHGMVIHHDASAVGPSPDLARYIAEIGRPPGTPAPLSQIWVGKRGVWHVLAAGKANHAGEGNGWGSIRAGLGNDDALGVEWDHTTGEKVTPEEYASLVLGTAAIFRAKGWSVDRACPGHKEYAKGRKTDPDIDMPRFRRDVKRVIAKMNKPVPRVPRTRGPHVDAALKAARQIGGNPRKVALANRAIKALEAIPFRKVK